MRPALTKDVRQKNGIWQCHVSEEDWRDCESEQDARTMSRLEEIFHSGQSWELSEGIELAKKYRLVDAVRSFELQLRDLRIKQEDEDSYFD